MEVTPEQELENKMDWILLLQNDLSVLKEKKPVLKRTRARLILVLQDHIKKLKTELPHGRTSD